MIYHYDGLINKQLKRRFWPSFGARSACYKRLSQLVSAGYLRAVRLPSATGLGSGPSLMTLGPSSHPILRKLLGLTHAEVRRLRHCFVPLLWQHDTAIRDFRLGLELACEGSELTLSDWINESELRRSPIKVKLEDGSKPISVELVPDGVFELTHASGQAKRYYLEMDFDTQHSPARFRKSKLRSYFAHIGSSVSPVLFVVPSEVRRWQLANWIQQEAQSLGANPRIFAIALREDVNRSSVLHASIWQVVGGPTQALLPEDVGRHQREEVAAEFNVQEGGRAWTR